VATIRIAIDIFSGRPNPVTELSGTGARTGLALLKSARRERSPILQFCTFMFVMHGHIKIR
jgi:hypothetical protein